MPRRSRCCCTTRQDFFPAMFVYETCMHNKYEINHKMKKNALFYHVLGIQTHTHTHLGRSRLKTNVLGVGQTINFVRICVLTRKLTRATERERERTRQQQQQQGVRIMKCDDILQDEKIFLKLKSYSPHKTTTKHVSHTHTHTDMPTPPGTRRSSSDGTDRK